MNGAGGVRRKAGAAGIGTLLVLIAIAVLLGPDALEGRDRGGTGGVSPVTGEAASVTRGGPDPALRAAVEARRSGVMVTLDAEIVRVLTDDNEGSRHQRLLLILDEAIGPVETILVAHNIDLAPRVPCTEGERIVVRGQYEWNDKGGVVHWTHHDPRARREGGWIEHAGTRYE